MPHQKEWKIQNIEELLNGIKDFTEGQKEIDGARGALGEFMEDVALATDLDKDTSDEDRVALMTIHLAKGLESCFCCWYGRRFISICDEYEHTIRKKKNVVCFMWR
jgi:ATP-dependent exoDNAse (exonuclease V) beta subunit